MCGIVGFLGHRQVSPILLKGLEKLSYRGYDSAGIAVIGDKKIIEVRKVQGKVERLNQLLEEKPVDGVLGIGHTRWATHGKPSNVNAHPHLDASGQIAVVHNGMIENEHELRLELIENGAVFESETDTEVIAQLLGQLYDGNMLRTIIKATERLKGSYALAILTSAEPDRIFFARRGSPLVAAYRDREGMIASDIPAILGFARDVICLEDEQIGVLSQNGILIYDETGKNVPCEASHVAWEETKAEKEGFPHYMLKEIYEQPLVLRCAAAGRGGLKGEWWFPMSAEEIRKLEKVTIIGCGTAYHAGFLGSYAMERIAHIPAQAEIASEYRYREPVIRENELIIAVSQSGETADTLAAVKAAVERGAKVLAVCNVAGSTLSREVGEKNTLYTYAGPEISVASTKAYVTQTELLILMAAVMGEARHQVTEARMAQLFECASRLPDDARQTLKLSSVVQQIAREEKEQSCVLFVGRCADYALSLEAALKLKEISYVFSQAYPAGELKHGPIALLKSGQLVVAVVTQSEVLDKMIANLQEIRTREAKLMVVCMQKFAISVQAYADRMVVIPDTDEWFAPILAVIPLQLFAYYMAVERECEVDQPRNLAKSVTVE